MIKSLVFCTGLLSTSAVAHSESALEMRDSCKGVVEGQTTLDGQITIPTTFEAGACWGAFSAVQGFSTMSFGGGESGALQLCIPPQTTRKQLVEVFYNYASLKPNLLHKDWQEVVWLSLDDAFPC